jgi:hypothetical protein
MRMNQQEIKEKNKKLKSILLKYKEEFDSLRRELLGVIAEYQRAIDNERLNESKEGLKKYEQ